MNDLPIVKVEIQRMEAQIYHAMTSWTDDLRKKTEAAVAAAFAAFDFDSEVKAQAAHLIRHEVRRQVERAVSDRISEELALHRTNIAEMVHDTLRERLK